MQIGFTFWYRLTRVVPDKGPINGCVLSRTTWVSWYQKEHSPTHTHEKEEGFAQTTRCALSQGWLSDRIKPAYNQSAGWLAQINSQCL